MVPAGLLGAGSADAVAALIGDLRVLMKRGAVVAQSHKLVGVRIQDVFGAVAADVTGFTHLAFFLSHLDLTVRNQLPSSHRSSKEKYRIRWNCLFDLVEPIDDSVLLILFPL